jgi:endoglycosylceramidase
VARLLALVAGIALALPVGSAAASPAEPLGSTGRWITDAEGRVVVLHGVNLVTKRSPSLPSAAGWGADDARYLAEEGFNTVRLGFDYGAIEPAPGIYDAAFIDAIAGEAQVAADEGLFVLVDVHQDMFTQRFQGNGLPDWMAFDDGEPNPSLGFPGNYFQNPALQAAFDNFWADIDAGDGTSLQEHYAEGLTRLAAELSGNSGLLGFDVFNEPWPGSAWGSCFLPDGCPGPAGFDATLLSDFNERAVAAVRAGDPKHIAFYEPNLNFDYGAPTGVRDPSDPNTAMSFHNYCIFSDPDGDPPECAEQEQRVFANADAHSAATGNGLLMTEFGATDQTATMERLAAAADRSMVGWHYWTYSNIFAGNDFPSTSLIEDLDLPPTPDNVKQPAMDALARPYPQLVAGTPTSWSWDPAAKVFELGYSTTGPGGVGFPGGDARSVTEVFLPARHFPGGYEVSAAGATIASDPGARILRVRNCAGARQVSVAVGATVADAPGAGCVDRCAMVVRAKTKSKRTRLTGSVAGERLIGTSGPDRLKGRGGDDCVNGKSGRDFLSGGAGDDTLKPGGGADKVKCGKGGDVVLGADRRDRIAKDCEKVKRGKRMRR